MGRGLLSLLIVFAFFVEVIEPTTAFVRIGGSMTGRVFPVKSESQCRPLVKCRRETSDQSSLLSFRSQTHSAELQSPVQFLTATGPFDFSIPVFRLHPPPDLDPPKIRPKKSNRLA